MSFIDHPPRFTSPEISQRCEKHYGLRGALKPLPSERDQNFLLETPEGESFVVKVANAQADLDLLQAHQLLLEHLASRLRITPRVLPDQGG